MLEEIEKYKWKILLLIGILLIAVPSLLLLQTKNQTEKSGSDEIKVGYMPIAANLDLFVADEREYFSDEGVKVKLVSMSGGAVTAQTVSSGHLDIGNTAAIAVMMAENEGLDLEYLAGVTSKESWTEPPCKLLIRRNSSISKPKDLEGHKIAINSIGNIDEVFLLSWADKNNVSSEKIELTQVPFPNMGPALNNNRVSAIAACEPVTTVTTKIRKIAKPIPVDSSYRDDLGKEGPMGAGWFTTKKWIKQNPERTKSFVKAIRKAREYIKENPEKARSILSEYTNLKQKMADRIMLPSFPKRIEKGELQPMLDAAYRYGVVKEKLNEDKIISKYAK